MGLWPHETGSLRQEFKPLDTKSAQITVFFRDRFGAGFAALSDEKSVPLFQDVARDHPFGGDDVCPILLTAPVNALK